MSETNTSNLTIPSPYTLIRHLRYYAHSMNQSTRVISSYLNSPVKRLYDLLIGIILLLISLPVMVLVGLLILLTVGWPVVFIQQRVGEKGKLFRMYKFRTMRRGAAFMQEKYRYLNEADGPVFKIKNDPRFVGFGGWLSHSGLDELPQLINVLKGEMSLVGPRPLPENETLLLHPNNRRRASVRPGIVSWWVVSGSHSMQFHDWMELDRQYIAHASLMIDIIIMLKSFIIPVNHILTFQKHIVKETRLAQTYVQP